MLVAHGGRLTRIYKSEGRTGRCRVPRCFLRSIERDGLILLINFHNAIIITAPSVFVPANFVYRQIPVLF